MSDEKNPEIEITNEFNDEFEAEDEIVAEESALAKLKGLREKLRACEEEKREYLTGWQRSKADNLNAKKSWQEEKVKLSNLGKHELVEDLLPVLDSFEMAFSNQDKWNSVDESWRKGIEYIYNQFQEALERNAITAIKPEIGSDPDEDLHHIIEEKESQELDSGKILRVRRSGYKIDQVIIRPAEVLISK